MTGKNPHGKIMSAQQVVDELERRGIPAQIGSSGKQVHIPGFLVSVMCYEENDAQVTRREADGTGKIVKEMTYEIRNTCEDIADDILDACHM